jgi:hypothetical protein
MAKKNESNSSIEDLTDAQIYEAIRYLEREPENGDDADGDNGVLICVCLYIVLLIGLAFWWLQR